MDGKNGPVPLPEELPTGIENLLALAAVNEDFAAALAREPGEAARVSGVELTDAERAILSASTPEMLTQLAAVVNNRLPGLERRRFLELATAAVVTLAAGGAVTLNRGETIGAVSLLGNGRATPPQSPPPTGSRPDRPNQHRPVPRPKKETSGSGCNR